MMGLVVCLVRVKKDENELDVTYEQNTKNDRQPKNRDTRIPTKMDQKRSKNLLR